MKKIKMLDLFAGCGGLEDGFMQTELYEDVAAVEWLKPQVLTLRNRLKNKYNIIDSDERVIHFDIQKEELFTGWKGIKDFDDSVGLDYYVKKAQGIDIIIGGPPCQAYSIAGRVRDENGMKDDYRNFLFEHYLTVVDRYKPELFVFENVPGILSANPSGTPIIKTIKDEFSKIGYIISDDLKNDASINAVDYNVPQNRTRIIIVGIRKRKQDDEQKLLKEFYKTILPKYRGNEKLTVKSAIGDLPACMPLFDVENHKKRKSHITPKCEISWHKPRYHNLRDMDTFRVLAEDIETGKREYDSKKITQLYEEKIGSKSPIHRYHVLEKDSPSTTIIAHLYKDGNRFIHYDSSQCRSITVREAARLQSFDDDYEFIASQGSAYQMIGNAVPPKLAKAIGFAIKDLLTIMEE